MRKPKLLSIALFISLFVISLPQGLLLAQNTNSGDIRGTATDASGAVVPNVTVTVVDIDKNVIHTYVTNGAGLYDTGPIVPDHYRVTFTRQGFATYVRGPITLQVGISTIDGHLQVGAATETVTVNTDLPLLETETGSQSTTLTSQTMEQLPQVGENWENFIFLMPGASGTPQRGGSSVKPDQHSSVNGSLGYYSVLSDGADTTLALSENAGDLTFETISEVDVSTSAFSAQYGLGGTVYNQITKGGTNAFHGAVYEYFRNNALNASPYAFGKHIGIPIQRRNNFGFSIGGPVLRNKMFFYFNFDKNLSFSGSASNSSVTVPTVAMRAGDFTGLPTVYDPTTQTVDSKGMLHRKSFASEYGNGNKIPASLIDPVAKAIQAYYPAPNDPGTITTKKGITTTANNFVYNVPSRDNTPTYFGRLDYDLTTHNRLTMSAIDGNSPDNRLGEGTCPIDCYEADSENLNSQVSDVWTISPNTINEARMGFNYAYNFYSPFTLNQGFPAKLGLKFAKADLFPTFSVGGNIPCCYTLQPGIHTNDKQFNYDPSDVVTMIRGRHVLHFGGEFLMKQSNQTPWGNINAATLSFSGAYTASTKGNTDTGLGYADFLLGRANSWSAGTTPEYGARIKSPQLFIQDDIKMRPNLTVNVGLRWQGMPGISEVQDKEQVFDPTVFNPAANRLGALWSAKTRANGRTKLIAPNWTNFLPRVGFSYKAYSNMVIRGGFGLYAFTWSLDNYGQGVASNSGVGGNEGDSTNGVLPVVLLDSDGNTNYQGSAGASVNSQYIPPSTDPSAFNGQSVTYNQYHTPVPKLYEYNLEIQREISTNMAVSVAYVGSHGFNLAFPTDINQVPEDKLGPNDATGPTNARPYPQYKAIHNGSTNNSISNYNSLQASIQRRLTSGFEFNFNYTWSKLLDEQDTSGQAGGGGTEGLVQNSYVPGQNYGPSNFDVRNMFKGSVIYYLPVGKGRRFVNDNYLLDLLIGGWETSGTVIAQSGNPFTVVTANNTSFSQAGVQYPNVVSDPFAGPYRTTKHWFNVAAFAQPASATFGNSRRNSLYGPGLSNINFALGKNFSFWRETSLQIRANATNVLNHPSFAQPDTRVDTLGQHIGEITGVTVGGRTMQLNARFTF